MWTIHISNAIENVENSLVTVVFDEFRFIFAFAILQISLAET
jgi:hypothetical protein